MVAEVREIDLGAKAVRVTVGRDSEVRTVPYDQLVIALGQVVDLSRMPGLADRAFVMKDVMDAFRIRNQVLGCLEDADATTEPRRRRSLLTFVVIGGGFTGVETVGELQELIRKSLKYYPNIRPDEIRTILIQYGSRILPELPEHLATYAAEKLRRRGIEIRLNTGVKAATPAGVETDSGPPIDAETIVAAIGNAPSPLLQSLPVTMERGRIVVDPLRVRGQEDVWALGDNAHIPLGDPNRDNVAYAPPLAQFAFREAKVLRATSSPTLKTGPSRRSSTAHSAPWRRWAGAAASRTSSASGSAGSPRGRVAPLLSPASCPVSPLDCGSLRTGCSNFWSAGASPRSAPHNQEAATFASSRAIW